MELKVFSALAGLNALAFSRHKPQQTPQVKNFVVIDEVLKRRNKATKKSNLTSQQDSICYTFSIDSHDYLLHINSINAGGGFNRINLVVIDSNGLAINPSYLFRSSIPALINEYLKYPNSIKLREAIKVKQLKDRVYIINTTIKVRAKRDRGDITDNKATKYLNNYLYWAKESATPPYKYIIETAGGGHSEIVNSSTVEVAKHFETNLPDTKRYQNILLLDSGNIRTYQSEDSIGGQASSLLHMQVESLEELPTQFDTTKYIRVFIERNDGLPFFVVYRYDHILHNWVIDYTTRHEPIENVYLKRVTDLSQAPTYPEAPYWIFQIMEAKDRIDEGYYVEYDRGAWRECDKPSSPTVIYEETLPFVLFKQGSDFYLDTIEATKKRSTTPSPPFIGETIEDIFLYNNRLGIITSSTVTLSSTIERDKPFNFFYPTATTVSANDPKYIGISDTRNGRIKSVSTFSQGFYIFTEEGIFFSQETVTNDLNTNISIRKITDMRVSHVYSRGDIVYFLTHNRLYHLLGGEIKEIGLHIRQLLKDIIDIAYNQQNRILYALKSDFKTILTIANDACFPLEFKAHIFAIEAIGTKLVLCKDTGIYSLEVVEHNTTVYSDDDGEFKSILQVPKNILGDGDNLLRYFFKRFSLYPLNQEYILRIKKYPRATIINRIDETSNKAVISGDNHTANIYIESVEDKPLEIELIELTIERGR